MIQFTLKTSVMIGSLKSKKFVYSQIFDQQSLRTKAESHIIRFLELISVVTNIQIIHFVFIVEHDTPPSQTSKTDYGIWWVKFPGVGTSQWPKLWSSSWPDMNTIDPSFWFLIRNNARSTFDADVNRKKRVLQKNGHKRKKISAVFQSTSVVDCYLTN